MMLRTFPVVMRKFLTCIFKKFYIKSNQTMNFLDYAQKLETQARQAESQIALLKAEVVQLQKAVDFCKKNFQNLELQTLHEISFENKKLKKEIEHWKRLLIEAEKRKSVSFISTEIDELNVSLSRKPSVARECENKIPDLVINNSLKKEKKQHNKELPTNTKDDLPIDFRRLDIRVGKIINIKKHPHADTLYIEDVDLGETKLRTVVSGLVKYVTIAEMENRMVIALCNLKPAKMRGIMSEAMILCASTPEKVEILSPPKGSCPGDKVTVKGFEGEPDSVLNPKKKIFEKVSSDLKVDEQKVATYKGIPFNILGKGVVTSQSLINVHIK